MAVFYLQYAEMDTEITEHEPEIKYIDTCTICNHIISINKTFNDKTDRAGQILLCILIPIFIFMHKLIFSF